MLRGRKIRIERRGAEVAERKNPVCHSHSVCATAFNLFLFNHVRKQIPADADLLFVDRVRHTGVAAEFYLGAEFREHISRFGDAFERHMRIGIAGADENGRVGQ